MDEIITKEEIKVENMIYKIRGKQVILDSDLLSYIIVSMELNL